MKVDHVINTLATGGAERLVVDIATEMQQLGHHVRIIQLCPPPPNSVPEALARERHLEIVTLSHMKASPAIAKKLRQATGDTDVVHAHLFPAFYWAATLKGPVKAVTEHSPTNSRRIKPISLIDRSIYRHYDKHFAISDGVAESLARHLLMPPQNVTVVRNGIRLQDFPQQIRAYDKPTKDFPFRIICVGTHDERKNFSFALEAISKLSMTTAYFVGDGPLRDQLEKEANTLGISNRVFFLGRRDDIGAQLNKADLLLMTSRYEGFGLVAAEAMATGLPVVAPRIPGLMEVVQHGRTGILYESGNEGECLAALTLLRDTPELRRQYAHSAASEAQRFSVHNTTLQYLESYKKTIQAKAARFR